MKYDGNGGVSIAAAFPAEKNVCGYWPRLELFDPPQWA